MRPPVLFLTEMHVGVDSALSKTRYPLNVGFTTRKKCVVVIGARKFIELFRLVRRLKEFFPKPYRDNAIHCSVNKQQRNMNVPDFFDGIKLTVKNKPYGQKRIDCLCNISCG